MLPFPRLLVKPFFKKFQSARPDAFPASFGHEKRHLSRDASLTGSLLLSPFLTIVAAVMLNFCVRDGYRCLHHAVTTGFEGRSFKTAYDLVLLWSSPRPISAGPLSTSPCLHFRSINLIVFEGPYQLSGRSHLGGGFTLRCLQRLSLPDLATQLCHWRDNWCTIGPSTPVLSY